MSFVLNKNLANATMPEVTCSPFLSPRTAELLHLVSLQRAVVNIHWECTGPALWNSQTQGSGIVPAQGDPNQGACQHHSAFGLRPLGGIRQVAELLKVSVFSSANSRWPYTSHSCCEVQQILVWVKSSEPGMAWIPSLRRLRQEDFQFRSCSEQFSETVSETIYLELSAYSNTSAMNAYSAIIVILKITKMLHTKYI